MTDIDHNRKRFEFHGKKLRRARRLFLAMNAKHVVNNIDLNRVAAAMIEHKLYAEVTTLRECRYRILRAKWKLDGGHDKPWPNPMCWHEWCRREGWGFGQFEKIENYAQA